MHRMEDVSWAIRRMEILLWKYREMCRGDRHVWIRFKRFFQSSSLLDRQLQANLDKSKKDLQFWHQKFNEHMQAYNQFYARIEPSLNKFQSYSVFNALDSNDQENFKSLYGLLKLRELNQDTQSLPSQDIINAIKQVQVEERNYQLFMDYYEALRDTLFQQSRVFKMESQGLRSDLASKELALDVMSGHRLEIQTLGAMIIKYRDFLLRTHPYRHFRSQWGLKWLVDSKHTQCKRLLQLTYEVESLDALYEKLRDSLEKGPRDDVEKDLSNASQNMNRWLYEISQPLSSREMVHTNVEHIINDLNGLNEIGSFHKDVVDFVAQVLSKTMRADWKYNVAFGILKFHEIYEIHMGLVGRSEDRQHFNRMKKFKYILEQIEGWTKKKITQRHIQEIEQDLSDIKVYLQDFLAFVQRATTVPLSDSNNQKVEELRQDIFRQLLEYRYQFGQFLHQFSPSEPEERSLRNQFLFIYRYFEAIETKINSPS